MVHFYDIPIELKWMFLESLTDDNDFDRSRHTIGRCMDRVHAVAALRLTDKQNAHDYAPIQGELRAAQITLDSYGVQQLQWLAKSSLAPHITDLELLERVVLPHVAVYDALGDQSLLPKNIQKRVKKLTSKKDDAVLHLVKDGFRPLPPPEYRPWTQARQEWSSNEVELKGRFFGTRNITDNELRTLLNDDGSDRNINLIRSTLLAFSSIRNINTWQVFAAKRVWLQPTGLETDIPMLHRWLDPSGISSQGWKTSARAPFSVHVFQLLRDLSVSRNLQSVALPHWSHGNENIIGPYDRPDKQSIITMFKSMPNLHTLSLHGRSRTLTEFQEDPALIHATCRALTSRPLPSLRHLEISDCHVTRTMTDMVKAQRLISLTMNGEESRYSAQSFLHVGSLIAILEAARDMPLLGKLDIEDFAIWNLLLDTVSFYERRPYDREELDTAIDKIREFHENGKMRITFVENDFEISSSSDEDDDEQRDDPHLSDEDAGRMEGVVFNTIA